MGRVDRVYFNLHRKLWSVQTDGRLRAHWADVVLDGPVTFRVQAAGRARVLRERRKSVHAFACGSAREGRAPRRGVRVTYNPYRAGFFYAVSGPQRGREVVGGAGARLRADDRSVCVIKPVYGERRI